MSPGGTFAKLGKLIIPKPELGIPLLTMIINPLLVWTSRHFPYQKPPFCGGFPNKDDSLDP